MTSRQICNGMTGLVAMPSSINTSNVNNALASWRNSASARHRQRDSRSEFAMLRQCLIGNARYQDRARRL
jgi:hypothetical protein